MFQRFIRDAPLVFIGVAVISGILLSDTIGGAPVYWWVAASGLLILTVVVRRTPAVLACQLIILAVLGGLRYAEQSNLPANHLIYWVSEATIQAFQGRVVTAEQRADGSIRLVLDRVFCNEAEAINPGRLLIQVRHPRRSYEYGDRVQIHSTVEPLPYRRNPGQFDYRGYLMKQSIGGIVYLQDDQHVVVTGRERSVVGDAAYRVRRHIERLIDTSVQGEANAILKALIVGIREDISAETRQAFADSGVIHVIAVSGLHVGYVTMVFLLLFGFLRLPRRATVILTVAALAFYAVVVGLKPSVNRAVIMASMMLIGQAWERRTNIYNTIAAAAVIQLLIDPGQLFGIGFQLSFVAVLSIVYLYQLLEKKIPPGYRDRLIASGLPWRILQLFLVSLAAFLGTLPLTIYHFQRIPVISLIANLIVVPLVGLIGAIGFAQVILGSLWPTINLAYGELEMILIGLLKVVIRFFAGLPGAVFTIPHLPFGLILTGFGILLAILHHPSRRWRFVGLLLTLVLLNFWIWRSVLRAPSMTVTFLDVGQGDAALIEYPGGRTMLIDAGDLSWRRDYGALVVAPFLRYKGIKRLDYLVLTHPHGDHIGGAPYILRHFVVGEVWQSDFPAQSRLYHTIQHLIDSLRISARYPTAGESFDLKDGSRIRCLHPSARFLQNHRHGYNDVSLVLTIEYGQTKVLFTGDIETRAEQYVVLWQAQGAADLLKVPHHGSATSSTAAFLAQVKPEIALVSVGNPNKFGHPDSLTMQRYRDNGSAIHRTDLRGALVVQSNGKKFRLIDWRKQESP